MNLRLLRKRLRRKWWRVKQRVTYHLQEPAWDVVGGSLSGLFVGRTVVYTSLAISLASTGFIVISSAMLSLIAFDAFISFHALRGLRNLMWYEALDELYGGALSRNAYAVVHA